MTESSTTTPRIIQTRPENLNASGKRHRGPNIYSSLLPLIQSLPSPSSSSSFLSSFISSLSLSNNSNPLAPKQIEAILDSMTQMIIVNKEEDMVRLWREGFFGKGLLSRSEPSWKRRVENKIAEAEGREKKLTSEEITSLRRIERKGLKQIKKLEREVEKFAAATAAASLREDGNSTVGGSSPSLSSENLIEEEGEELEELEKIEEQEEEEEEADEPTEEANEDEDEEEEEEEEEKEEILPPPTWQLSAEFTQLQPEEAFFLLFLGVISIRTTPSFLSTSLSTSSTSTISESESSSETLLSAPLSILNAWKIFLLQAFNLPLPSIPLPSPSSTSLPLSVTLDPRLNRWDSPFLIKYSSYHHFRSLGWVVRSGVKFCSEWVLYGQGGPVGGHAEFAVILSINYSDPLDSKSNPFKSTSSSNPTMFYSDDDNKSNVTGEDLEAEGEKKNSWKWFNTVNRVCSGVKKTLVILQILLPPLSSLPKDEPNWIANNPAKALSMLQMREITFRRFLAGRMRD